MIAFIIALTYAIAYGIGENRLFKEEGEWWLLNHFKAYHVWLLYITIIVSACGAEGSWLKFAFLMVWTPLMLDVTWWIIRYYQITHGENQYGEPNAWHLQSDWDNWLGLPLVAGCYWWWWVLSIVCAVLGALIVTVA